jgi:hypothetical protein
MTAQIISESAIRAGKQKAGSDAAALKTRVNAA